MHIILIISVNREQITFKSVTKGQAVMENNYILGNSDLAIGYVSQNSYSNSEIRAYPGATLLCDALNLAKQCVGACLRFSQDNTVALTFSLANETGDSTIIIPSMNISDE